MRAPFYHLAGLQELPVRARTTSGFVGGARQDGAGADASLILIGFQALSNISGAIDLSTSFEVTLIRLQRESVHRHSGGQLSFSFRSISSPRAVALGIADDYPFPVTSGLGAPLPPNIDPVRNPAAAWGIPVGAHRPDPVTSSTVCRSSALNGAELPVLHCPTRRGRRATLPAIPMSGDFRGCRTGANTG